MKKIILLVVGLLLCSLPGFASGIFSPDTTCLFAVKDSSSLYLDFYAPTGDRFLDGKEKPAVIFVFGGGFMEGSRNKDSYLPWFQRLSEEGYPVFSIDYRLGMKGVKAKGLKFVKAMDYAIRIAVEDLFSATSFIVENASLFDVDPANLVVSGSSAGAITSMQAEYEICNDTPTASILPPGFNYAGVMSFAGAILSFKGKLKYSHEPCPQLLLHGTADKVVAYKQIKVLRIGFFGSSKIVERLRKFGFVYNILRYVGHGHDIASHLFATLPDQLRFLETNVVLGVPRIVDSTIDDPQVPLLTGGHSNLKDLYD